MSLESMRTCEALKRPWRDRHRPDWRWLTPGALVGFRGGGAGSRNQACDKGAEQGSPTPARVVDELEEAEVERQLVLRDAPVRAEPGAQQGPEPLHGGDVHLTEPIPVLVAFQLPTSRFGDRELRAQGDVGEP